MAHREHNRAPVGAYNEDYHYFTYEEQPNGDYIEYKVIVAKNGSTRTVLHEEIDKEEYFKRKLAGTLKNDKLFTETKMYGIERLQEFLDRKWKNV